MAGKQPDRLFDLGMRALWVLVVAVAIGVGVAEGALHWLHWSYALLAAAVAAMAVAAWRLRSRGRSLALAMGAVTSLLVYAVVQAGPYAHDEVSSHQFAKTLAGHTPSSAVVYVLARDAYEFQRIATDVAEINAARAQDLQSLPPAAAGQSEFLLVQDRGLAEVRHACGRETRVVTRTSRYCLLELMPRPSN